MNMKKNQNLLNSQFSVGVQKISIKTGTHRRAGTDAVATLRICDSLENCCHTGDLDNHGNDRSKGQTDVYENSLLSDCRQVTFLDITFVQQKMESRK